MPQAEDPILFDVFQKYCIFGTRHSSLGGEERRNSINVPQMDGSKFSKIIREAGLVDNTFITPIEVDITFSRVKDKGERRISYVQFRKAMRQLAEKKYYIGTPRAELSAEDAEERLLVRIRNLDAPLLAVGTTKPERSPLLDRLMEGPPTYISKSPRDDSRTWKDDLRRASSSPSSRRASSTVRNGATDSPKSSLNPATIAAMHPPCENYSPSKDTIISDPEYC